MRLRRGGRGRRLSGFETWRWWIGHDERVCDGPLDTMVKVTYLSRQDDAAVTRVQSADLIRWSALWGSSLCVDQMVSQT